MGEPSVLEMETSPETAAYRDSQKKVWTALGERRAAYLADATRHGATPAQASEAAAKHVRGEIRAFLTELIAGAPGPAVGTFFMNAPHGWMDNTEVLLDDPRAVLELIRHCYPSNQWAGRIHALAKAHAEDMKTWGGWAEMVRQEIGLVAAKGADAAGAALGAMKNAAEGASDIGRGLGKALEMLPLALGALGLGALAIAYSRRETQVHAIREEE